ncbi:MAG: CusA/CzcA family heavy metal efflux RND transporter [Pseudomonadota bacterium]|jgi:cobalt-zinc-cadmium resistance protein CzcA|uniref:efflux RND transporter permease subunit n=2 Tax=Burkholderiaceae TaxID=119060 RepID=UPI0010F8AD26|nr:CusA/CzcA family heavy metal efflux RND transporter [Burkholderia sp. 4M9327F10]
MIKRLIDAVITRCFEKRVAVIFVAVLVVIFGYYSWTQMAVEAYPELTDVTAQVTTQVPGLAAEEIEQQVTTPLERALASTPGVVMMRSSSTFGLSLITMVFKDGAEDYWSRERINDRLSGVTLPAGVTPSLDPVSGPAGEIYRYTLESDTKNLMQLSEIQNWTVIPGLMEVPGVANVDNFGGFTKEYQLEIDPKQLMRYNVAISDVMTAINANNGNSGGGRVTRGEQSYIVRGIGQVHTLKDLGNIVVTQRNGVPVLVRDLGKLVYGHQVREGVLGKDNNPDTIEGIVDLLKYQNPSKVLEDVHAKVNELQKQLAPMGVRIVPYIDRDDLVHATIDKVSHTVMEGVGLVVIILILFLGSPRSAIVAAVTIPLALVTVFILMHLTKMPANLFSLGAIDFGVIVDGAIVVTEAILRKRESNPNDVLSATSVLEATRQVAHPIFFATLIITAAYLPLFAFERAEGKLFQPMAYTVGYALFGALLATLTLIPGLAYMALRKPRKIHHNRVLTSLQQAYFHSLDWFLARHRLSYVIGAVSLTLVIVLGATIGREFLPELDEGSLWLQVQMPSGLSVDKAIDMANELRRVVREFPEVSYIVTQLGRNDTGTDPWTPSHIESCVGLTPYSKWHGETKGQFIDRLNARLKQIPGISVGISQPIVDGEDDMIGGAHSALVLRVYGEDFKEMRRIGGDIVDVLKGIRGTNDASIFQEPEIPQLVVETDRDAAARYGINVADVSTLIQNAIGGAPITQVFVADRTYNVTLHVPRSSVTDREALGQLPLTSTSGAKVPLSMVARISLKTGESTIAHEMGKRQITIRVDNRDRALSDYLAEAQQKIDQNVKYDHEKYHLEWAGTFENEQRAQKRLAVSFLVVMGIMLTLLIGNFGNSRQALLVLGVVPLATLGGLIALHVRGETLNIATAVGFIALFGVAVQNGIIMVSNFNRLRAMGTPLRDAVTTGAIERFRPVLMTATVATAGMLPAAIATGVGTDVQRGLATVVVGGLGVATLLTLYILPTYYYVLERHVELRNSNKRDEEQA